MTILGAALFIASAGLLAWNYRRTPCRRSYPIYGLLGLAVMGATTVLLALRVCVVTIYFTPLMWTGYILAVDAAVLAIRGRSMLASRRTAFAAMALLSIPLWLVFEGYNVRLQNWIYTGLPENLLLRCAGYTWSFATIWPAVLETTEFLLATWPREGYHRPLVLPPKVFAGLGTVLMALPIALPRD